MWQERAQRYILPGSIEQDPRFRDEIQRLSRIGLLVIGSIAIAVSAFMTSAHVLLDPRGEMLPVRAAMLGSLLVLGLLTILTTRSEALLRRGRLIAILAATVGNGIVTWSLLLLTQFDRNAVAGIPGNITMIMLVAAAAIPFRPTDMLVVGFIMEAEYVALALLAARLYSVGRGVDPLYVLFIFMVTCLSTALTAVVYEQRRSTYEWHKRTLETAEKLREAEARNLLSENAASVGRLAAALSHELNSPIGALVSGVDTLLLLAARQPHSTPQEQQRLLVLQNELRKSIQQSTDRLREIVARMQRFSNLDMAEVQSANVNDLITDVAALLDRPEDKVEVEMDLQPVPPLVCRPQQLSAVFSNLLGNAIDATNGDGRVVVSSRSRDSAVEVAFSDNGRGLHPNELETIFDPGFRVSHGRVATGNWSMFSSRQIVREHGGEIRIESERGKGTCVRVLLPVNAVSENV
ncbi:MAG TPA: HAMP domain-containing sensor histidine kinase [Bryobacteraceae bacterium]|nr:HAMP domain-containing sensor histidine kinase [Bryobacteraceae bacterium]